MTPRVRSALALSVVALAVLFQGCITAALVGGAAAAGGTTAVYRRGWYRGAVNSPHFKVDQALRRTCRRARLIERERTCDGYRSSYRYQDLKDVKVKIQLKAITPDSTKVFIHVGFWGDRSSSAELFQALQEDIAALGDKTDVR